jgi:FkbM family methyltransferase
MRDTPFSPQLVGVASQCPLVLADLGARGAVDEDLLPLAGITSVIGFEPDAAEAARLGAIKGPWQSLSVLPHAIGARDGIETLHIPAAPVGASLLPHNERLIDLFGNSALLRTVRQVSVPTRTLDSLSVEGVLPRVDYLKIDIEGAELDVLKSGRRVLEDCVAVKVECSFIERRVDEPLAHKAIDFMTEARFALVDVLDVHRWRRRNLPSHPYSIRFMMPYSRGRVKQADFLFFREFDETADMSAVNRAVLVSACLGYFDHSWTLVQQYPSVRDWWSARGVDIRNELRFASRRAGRAAVQGAMLQHMRQFIPLFRSLCGMLPFTEPRDPPY